MKKANSALNVLHTPVKVNIFLCLFKVLSEENIIFGYGTAWQRPCIGKPFSKAIYALKIFHFLMVIFGIRSEKSLKTTQNDTFYIFQK